MPCLRASSHGLRQQESRPIGDNGVPSRDNNVQDSVTCIVGGRSVKHTCKRCHCMHTSSTGKEDRSDSGQSDPDMSTGEVCYPLQQSTSEEKAAVSSVCRALFGPTDHERNRQFVRTELEVQRDKDRETWNFDFEQEVPMTGRYEWTPVREPYRLRSTEKEEPTAHQQQSKPVASCSRPSRGGVTTQTRIPDYMKKKKQATRAKSASARSVNPKSE